MIIIRSSEVFSLAVVHSVFYDVDGFNEVENIKRLYANEDEEGLMEAAVRLKKVIDDAEMHLSNIISLLKK